MTPLEWFKSKGYGSQKVAARKIGYSCYHLNLVLNKIRPPSKYFISCLNQYCGMEFKESDFLPGCK